MADIEPPTFSLGLDLDFESGPQNQALNSPTHEPLCAFEKQIDEEDDDEHQLPVPDSDLDDPGPTLLRLRRGGLSSSKPISAPHIQESEKVPISHFADDDIEEFSSQEHIDTDYIPAPQYHSLSSGSKIPLSGCGVLTSQQGTKVLNKKRKPNSSCPPTSAEGSKKKSVLPDFTASPLRRFQLLDSDSDDPSESVCLDRDATVGCSKQNEQEEWTKEYCQVTCEKNTESPTLVSEKKQDLWKDFYEVKSCIVPTPAFDEFCEEYFNAARQKREAPCSAPELCSNGQGKNMSFTKKMMQQRDSGSASPPSHRYFFHHDSQIQSLVRSRLSHFSPLRASGDTGSNPSDASAIDYKSLFCHGDGAKKQTGRQVNVRKSSQRSRKKANNSNVENTLHASGDWTNPKQTVNTPKDAGRRRVHADGQSGGHWFTGENGRKVYVTSAGKELTGRVAYRHYRKESGRGFKDSRKKAAAKKSASKKK